MSFFEIILHFIELLFRVKQDMDRPESKRIPPAKRKPSKVVKVVIKSTNGEKHGWIEDHTKR